MPWTDAYEDLGLLSPGPAGSPVEAATGDAAYVRAMLDAEAALTRAQAALGLAPATAAQAVTAAAAETGRYDVRDLALRARSGGNPVIPLVADLTAAVADRDRQAAAHVHRGATSQDILDTATMLVAARALDSVLADLGRTADALARLAAGHRNTPIAGRTLTQHAVPTTFGLKAAGWRSLVLDAHERLAAVRATLPAQLGGAAGTLAAFHAFAEAGGATAGPDPGPDPGLRLLAGYAAETGLAEPTLPWHTLRTPVADLGGALAFTAGALGKLAADVLLLSRTEIGELGEGSGGGSSAMPHKANPVRATLVTAAARQVPALTSMLYAGLAAEDERPAGAWHAEWQPLRQALRLVGGAARDAGELAEGLRVHPRRMRENLDATGGLLISERLAAVLSASIGRGEAGQALSRASRRAVEQGMELDEALREEPGIARVLPQDQLRELTDPTRYSGSAGALVDRALLRTIPAGKRLDEASDIDAAEQPRTGPSREPSATTQRPSGSPAHSVRGDRMSTSAPAQRLLHHRVDGRGSAPPLILGPSLGTSLAVWDPQTPSLARTHRVVRWDLPGHGGSPAGLLPDGGTVADLGRLVLGLADALGIEEFGYAGISLGGAVGTWLAVHHPERVTSLAILCSSARFGRPEGWSDRAGLVRAEGIGPVAETAPARWFTPPFAASPAARAMVDDLSAADPGAYAGLCEALAGFDLRAELPRITAPTLIVAGREDPATPVAHARELADAIPGAALTEVAHAAHLANVERPVPVLAALLGHFAADAAPPADDASRHRAGTAVRRAVLGDEHVDRAITGTTDFTAGFQDFITRYAWGEIWTRPGLSRRTRSCITLTALVAHGHHEELAMHVRAARRNGLTPAEIEEVLLQSAVYCGVPAANAAFAIANRILEEEN